MFKFIPDWFLLFQGFWYFRLHILFISILYWIATFFLFNPLFALYLLNIIFTADTCYISKLLRVFYNTFSDFILKLLIRIKYFLVGIFLRLIVKFTYLISTLSQMIINFTICGFIKNLILIYLLYIKIRLIIFDKLVFTISLGGSDCRYTNTLRLSQFYNLIRIFLKFCTLYSYWIQTCTLPFQDTLWMQ